MNYIKAYNCLIKPKHSCKTWITQFVTLAYVKKGMILLLNLIKCINNINIFVLLLLLLLFNNML